MKRNDEEGQEKRRRRRKEEGGGSDVFFSHTERRGRTGTNWRKREPKISQGCINATPK